MKRLVQASALVLLCTGCDRMAASADSKPLDLRGHWVGTSESIVRGAPPHHASQTGANPLLDNVRFDFNIIGQDGRRFWGTVSSTKSDAEPLVGVIAYDGKTIVAEDTDGTLQGTIVDADTIDGVYSHTGASTVVAANRIKRQK